MYPANPATHLVTARCAGYISLRRRHHNAAASDRSLRPYTLRMASASRPAPVVLLVLDGWGYRAEKEGNAIAMANVPTWDRLWANAPRTLLEASGEAVGLPCGQIGNSEVGHLNLGAGRVVKQDLVRISDAIADGSFFTNPVFVEACRAVKKNNGTLHLVGLIGTGG